MKKIIFLFLMFSGIVFAEWKEEWEYGIHHNNYGLTFHDFTVYGAADSSQLTVSITTDIGSGSSSVTIFNKQIKNRNKYFLLITSDADTYSYDIFKKDIESGAIRVENVDGQRGNNLTKILASTNVIVLGLYNDKFGVLDIFLLKDLREAIKQKLGNSDWYKYNFND